MLRRIAAEHRSSVLPIAIGILLNILVYAFVVYPLGVRSAGAADRAARAATNRQAAERELAAAKELVTGKARAEDELNAFYRKVLPADLPAVRRMTYGPIPRLAERSNVTYLRRSYDEELLKIEYEAHLTRISIRMVFQGDYEDLREFIYQIESAPEFVIIDEIALSEGSSGDRPSLSLTLSTYFRTRTDGA